METIQHYSESEIEGFNKVFEQWKSEGGELHVTFTDGEHFIEAIASEEIKNFDTILKTNYPGKIHKMEIK